VFIPEYNKKFAVEPKNPEGIWSPPPAAIIQGHMQSLQ
jgi:hypothetical protein